MTEIKKQWHMPGLLKRAESEYGIKIPNNIQQNVDVFTLFGLMSITDFDINKVNIRHIAHSLSQSCRYNGATVDYYSVAEHCVLLARWYRKNALSWHQLEFCLALLLHDAAEAYVGDIIAPLKLYCPWIREIETNLDKEIFRAFELDFTDELHKEIKKFDLMIRNDEIERLIYPFNKQENKLGVNIKCWNPKRAEHEFINEFELLKRKIKEKKLK